MQVRFGPRLVSETSKVGKTQICCELVPGRNIKYQPLPTQLTRDNTALATEIDGLVTVMNMDQPRRAARAMRTRKSSQWEQQLEHALRNGR